MIGQTVSHYKILEKLGEGGMGVVYKAQDSTLDRLVAIKFLPPHMTASAESKSRFLQEAKATAALSHPNILSIYEIGEENGAVFFVMEYLEGKTLKDVVGQSKSGTGIPIKQAFDWTGQIAEGLRAAHAKHIVHRDIKPANVMLTNDGRIRVMDFGIAKLKDSTGMTRTGTSLGTLSYMAPEQAQGQAADERSDIWSLGVVLYELLTADLPFKSEHEAGLLYLIVNEEPPLPSLMDRKIPHPIDTLIKKMLAKDRAQRYQTMDEVLKALHETRDASESGQAAPQKKAIAVLPFGNISPDKESDYFSDGLTEELIVNLSRLKDIRVVPRTTSMQYKGTTKEVKAIGNELGTRYILAGSVRKFQDNLRIAVELVDVEADAQLWAETYKGKLADVFDIQEQVAKQIVDALMVKLTPIEKAVLSKRSTLNPEAFDCYLRAQGFLYRFSKSNINIALQLFERALELDQRYAPRTRGSARRTRICISISNERTFWLDKAIEACLKAQIYDPTLSEAYAALAVAYYNRKTFDEAIVAGRKAIELDRNNHIAYWILGRIYHNTDRDLESVELFKTAVSLNPDFYIAYSDLKLAYERLGDKERQAEIGRASLQTYPRMILQHPDDARAHMFYAIELAQVGRTEEAKAQAQISLEQSPGDTVSLYNAACFYAQMGEKRLALDTLRNATIAGWVDYEWIKRDTDLDPIRKEPEYIELMKDK